MNLSVSCIILFLPNHNSNKIYVRIACLFLKVAKCSIDLILESMTIFIEDYFCCRIKTKKVKNHENHWIRILFHHIRCVIYCSFSSEGCGFDSHQELSHCFFRSWAWQTSLHAKFLRNFFNRHKILNAKFKWSLIRFRINNFFFPCMTLLFLMGPSFSGVPGKCPFCPQGKAALAGLGRRESSVAETTLAYYLTWRELAHFPVWLTVCNHA